MIILGKCPNCEAEDTIYAPEAVEGERNWDAVCCNACNAKWPDWLKLIEAERANGKRLIAVDVQESWSGAHVPFPLKEEIPFLLTIAQVANAALMLRFKLTTCFACEGGVEGKVPGGYVELQNDYDRLGLTDDCWRPDAEPRKHAPLAWYADFLRVLFMSPLRAFGKDFGRGAILKLDPQAPGAENDAKLLLWLALCKKTRRRKFADAVFARLLGRETSPVERLYLRGPTNDDIVQFFVPPP